MSSEPHINNSDIASAIERGIVKQTDLITSLSLALIGGLLILMLQFKMHNAVHIDKAVEFENFPLFVFSLICAGLAILTGFLVSGMLIEIAPIFLRHEFKIDKFSKQNIDIAPINHLRYLSIFQVLV